MTVALIFAAALLQAAPAPAVAYDRPETATAGPALTVGSGSFGPGGFIPRATRRITTKCRCSPSTA